MSLAQRIYENRKNDHANALQLLVESTTKPVECTMENHFIMCFFLHNAEQYRQILMQEVREDCQASDFEHFPLALRNGCFDIYLQSRVRDWQEKSAKHPKAIRPFTELECFRYLFTFEEECHKKLLTEAPNEFIRQLMEYYMLYFSVVIKDKYPNEENLISCVRYSNRPRPPKAVRRRNNRRNTASISTARNWRSSICTPWTSLRRCLRKRRRVRRLNSQLF